MKPTLASRLCHWAIPVLLTTTLPVTSQADDMDSADSWFQNSYGPLWADAPFDNIDAILDHYSAEIVTHSSDGAIHRTPRREWLMAPMDSWQAEGWLRAELTEQFASHMDVNAVIWCDGGRKVAASVQAAAAENVKRVVRRTRVDWLKDDGQNPYLIRDTQEVKTTWHPIGT